MDKMRKYRRYLLLGAVTLLLLVMSSSLVTLAQDGDDDLDDHIVAEDNDFFSEDSDSFSEDIDSSATDPRAVLAPLGSAFNYQGHLQDGGRPANGAYDFRFRLFDAATSGSQVGNTITRGRLAVNDGVFTTSLSFGTDAFGTFEARWLEVAVRPGGSSGAYTALSPRTAVRADPYALVSGRLVSRDHAAGAVVYNPQDTRASVSLGWLNSIARIRIGGQGDTTSGAEGGLDIQSTSDRSLLRITHAGDAFARRHVYAGNSFRVRGSDQNNRITVGTAGDAGRIQSFGPNGKLNVYIGSRSSNRNLGSIHVYDADGTSRGYMRVRADGRGEVSSGMVRITGGSDLAEPFVINGVDEVEPGMVVVLDPDNPGQMRLATQAYDPLVAGVISGAGGVSPGIIMHQEDRQVEGETHPVALVGQVYVQAVGPIKVGDLLTSSDIPGYAMAATDRGRAFGAVIGKAMTALDEGEGLVLILVTLQ